MVRTITAAVAILGAGLLSAAALFAAEEEAEAREKFEGRVAMAQAGQLTATDREGKQHEFMLTEDAKITLDGKEAKLEDLKAGHFVTVFFDKDADKMVASEIQARSTAPDEEETVDEPETPEDL